MDQSQHKKAYKTAGELMRLSAERTGTVEELLLVETARFLLTQTDVIRKLQTDLDLLHVENSRLRHRRKPTGEYEEFWWTKSSLAQLVTQHTPTE